MPVNKSMFRAYDIRGVYGHDLNENVMEAIGNAFASEFVKGSVVVGMDGRDSGPSLKKAFISGVTSAGKSVTDVGLVPRGVCLFSAWKRRLPSAYITASHLAPEWNGVKFAHGSGTEFFEQDNYRIRDLVLSGKVTEAREKGKVDTAKPIYDYKKYVSSKIPKAKKPLKVVIDCGNGTGGLVAPQLFRTLGFEVKALFEKVDGRFPNRPSEIKEEALGRLMNEMKEADMGVAYDGDSDRMSLMDETGRLLGPETASYIILNELVRQEKGPVIANVECLKIMDEIAKKFGRKLFRIRVGNSFMVHEVNKKSACFGVERSGHFCIPSILPMDDGIAASLYAAVALSKSGMKLSEIANELPQYPFRRLKVECPDEKKFGVVERLKRSLSKKYDRVNTIDGVRVDFDYGWVLIRASNTEPIIRVSAEADDEKKMKDLAGKFKGLLLDEIRSS
jgi:phosphomannomutase